ncbi:RF-1 domain containing protein [Nitzschia inconspicua]|uniref:RF-1 domain containing protein n=1 Tax=Nitzschia inconspicua TaxID=303405 RepID=A0A9K3LP66_9STRA|nr:RF-1 domain containing protein [Nitzschia inconspicua]
MMLRSWMLVRAWQTPRITTAFRPISIDRAFISRIGIPRRYFATTNFQSDDDNIKSIAPELKMENLYTEWTLDQDRLLWEHHQDMTIAELAALLGRGLRGVENRLAKLRDVNSPSYERLFAQKQEKSQHNAKNSEMMKREKLIPAGEVLRRIQWDYTLSPSDFFIMHYDRVEDAILETPMDAPNDSIKGSSELLVDALPEHRIVAIKYKEQVVWDREKRLDLFFSNGGIESIISNYEEWKRRKNEHKEWIRLRQAHAAEVACSMIGQNRFGQFVSMSEEFQAMLDDPPTGYSVKKETEEFVTASVDLFRQAYRERTMLEAVDRAIDLEAVECLSELVAVSDNEDFQSVVLHELTVVQHRLEGRSSNLPTSTSNINDRQLPELNEDDITETFVRGSGAGGQKVNKTSNKVVLLHNPTNLRVECQETRSLQQNRKIARKRLRIKLDEFLNGKQSRANLLAEKASNKKAKAKARSRKRNRTKAAMKEDSN